MATWIDLCKTTELGPGKCRTVQIDGQAYAVYNVDGTFYCTEDACLHQGGPLGEGFLEGKCVSCPWHGWEYDVSTGVCSETGEAVKTFPTRVSGDLLQAEV